MPSEVFVGFLQDQVEILKEKVAKLEAENERLNGDMKVAIEAEKHRIELIKENAALQEQVARLTAPVSDEERLGWFSFFGDLNAYLASDHDVESIIAARSKH